MTVLLAASAALLPLTLPQREIWFDQLLHGDAPLYNIGGYMRLEGRLDVDLLRQSARLLVKKHDILRTVLRRPGKTAQTDAARDDGHDAMPLQGVGDASMADLVEVPVIDFSTQASPHEAAAAWMRDQFARPFALCGEALFRYAVLRLGEELHYSYACYHHLIADGWSIALLARSQAALYNALAEAAAAAPAGRAAPTMPAPAMLQAPSYAAFVENDRLYAESATFAAQRRYWLEKFQPLPEPLLRPKAAPRAGVSPVLPGGAPGACSTLRLPRHWYDDLDTFARGYGCTPFHALLTALAVYFTRVHQRDEFVVGLPVLNRLNAAFKATAGLFVGITAARLAVDGERTFGELMAGFARELKQDYRHQRFPVSHLSQDLGLLGQGGDAGRGARLFDIGLSYERHDYVVRVGQASGPAVPLINEHQATPLMIYVREFDAGQPVDVDFVFHHDYFSAADIAALQSRLVSLLEGAQAMPEAGAWRLPLATEAERRQVTLDWNATDVWYPKARPVFETVERQARLTPDAVAVVFEGRSLTCRELDEAANRLAHRLIAAGVLADTLVAVCAERSLEMVVGLLAVLKAGAAYVPLDPDYPAARIEAMLEDAGAACLLTERGLWQSIGAAARGVAIIDLSLSGSVGHSSASPAVKVDMRQLAYMIYTSGSTGQPKGAGVPHAGLANRLCWMQETYPLDGRDRVLQKTPFGFDVSVWEFFWPLMQGATLVVAPPGDHRDPARLAAIIRRERITTLHFVPSMLQVFVEHGELGGLDCLRQVMASGEALPADLQRRFLRQSPARLHNLYGPTEASIDVTAWECRDDDVATVPIGRPIANTRIYLLDENMLPVPPGVTGELYIGGVQLARGYHGRPDLTAERFVPDPFGVPGARLYRSGDLACWRADGAIDYLGRTDHQVKIRGQRIEPGEIEAVLLAHDAVAETTVMARADHGRDTRLVAYVVCRAAHAMESTDAAVASSLTAHLQRRLPQHMVPQRFVFLPRMPLTPNGKIDRKALPAPDLPPPASVEQAPGLSPTPVESLLAGLWLELLGHDPAGVAIGAGDHFFSLGGHSLLAARLVAKLRQSHGIELPLRTVFETPVLGQLAAKVEILLAGRAPAAAGAGAGSGAGGPAGDGGALSQPSASSSSSSSSLPLLLPLPLPSPSPSDGAPVMSFAQQRLWFLNRLEPASAFYNMAGGLALQGPLDRDALARAFDAIVARHDVLRTAYRLVGETPVQVIDSQARAPLVFLDLRQPDDPTDGRAADGALSPALLRKARQLALDHAAEPFDLGVAPMLRAQLLRLDARHHWLLLNMHHIAGDGWSMTLLERELAAFYNAEIARSPRDIGGPPVPALQYADYSAWQADLARTPHWQAGLDYWRRRLDGADGLLDLPLDRPRPARQTHRGRHVEFVLDAGVAAGLRGIGERHGATLFMTLLGAYGLLLSRYTGQTDINIGTPVANRRHAQFEDLIGCFVNTLVMRLAIDPSRDFLSTQEAVRETALQAYAHQDVAFEQLVDALGIERDLSRAPLFQTMFMLQRDERVAASGRCAGLETTPVEIVLPIAKFDLSLAMRDNDGRLEGSFEYSTDLFEHGTIERLAGHFVNLLGAIVDAPREPVGALALLSPQERRYQIEDLNDTGHAFALDACYASLFAQRVARHPERIAAVCLDERWTYAELDARSSRIAHALAAAGAGPDVLVGLVAERSLGFLAMVIAIFKAGAAYVPLDVDHPQARLRDIVARGRIPILLAGAASLALAKSLQAGAGSTPERQAAQVRASEQVRDREQSLEQGRNPDRHEGDGQDSENGRQRQPRLVVAEDHWLTGAVTALPFTGAPDNLAYVIFTSGSTGQPKGAMVERRGMLNNLYGKVPALGLGEHDRVAQTAAPAFDISVWQLLAAPLLGGAVHIMPAAVALDPQRLLVELAEQEITILQVVPSMMRHLVDIDLDGLPAATPDTDREGSRAAGRFAGGAGESGESVGSGASRQGGFTGPPRLSLRWVLSIGEALPPSLAQRWFERFPAIPLINIYGPAECADNIAFQVVRDAAQARAHDGLASVPVGRPTANTALFILDGAGQLVPPGVAGEICVAGAGVGRGYLGDPETTATAFIDHPFSPGQRFYRTGDRGRLRADGAIDYLGRRDHQIKIRGQRIELGEIEARLRACAGVRDAIALVRHSPAPANEPFIVAYWCAQQAAGARTPATVAADSGTLRRELAASLPHSMLPTALIELANLPVNANGKTDRRALAALPFDPPRAERAPQSSVETQLLAIWSTLLGQFDIGRDDNFFHIGGHSLLATRLMAQVSRVFGADLPLRTVFEAPTLRELAQRIDVGQGARPPSFPDSLPPLLPVDRRRRLPLSFSQQRLLFLDRLEPGRALYNMAGAWRLNGRLDVEAIEAALNDIVCRHEVLRTVFDTVDGATFQRIVAPALAPVNFALHDLREMAPQERLRQADALAAEDAARPFDLDRPPLLRARVLRLEDEHYRLLLTMHHVAADGWSTEIVLRELAAFYRARLTHRDAAPADLPAICGLAPLPVQYADFALWQHAALQAPVKAGQIDYWRSQLAGAPGLLELPTDRPRPAQQSYLGERLAFSFDAGLTGALRLLCRRSGTTMFMALSSAFALLLGRYSGQDDICIGTPVAGRARHELEHLVGFFVNTLVMRYRLPLAEPFDKLLRQARETCLAAYANQDLPFEQLVEVLQPPRHLSHAPLFQAMFVLQNAGAAVSTDAGGVLPDGAPGLDGLEVTALPAQGAGVARFDITLQVTESADTLEAAFEFSTDLFDTATMERMGAHLRHLLEAIVAAPQTAIGELPLLPPAERALMLDDWNRTSQALPPFPTIHRLFENTVARFPDAVAAVCGRERLTYAGLNARANRLAHYLREKGVGPDDLVGICVERSLDMIVAVLAVLKAGGAYLPLDPSLPPARIAFMIEDAGPALLLTQAASRPRLPGGVAQLRLDADREMFAGQPDHDPETRTLADHLAYVIYTSGSTGRPKGTLIHHRGLINLVLAQQQAFGLGPRSRVLQWASFNFDASVSEIFTALTVGARLYLASGEAMLPGRNLVDTLREKRIELVTLTPSSLAAMPVTDLPHLRTLVVAGEHCDHALIAPWLKRYTVINAYGPTEATVCATVYPCSDDGRRHPAIGRPIANTQVFILDAWMNPVPVGVTGELYIGGEGLARGYLGRPDLTAERFIQNPFSGQPGARMYRSGDLARFRADGQIEYIGRIDHQVKIRGYRVELGEIEFALDQIDGVREAAVLARPAPGGGWQLVAYVACDTPVARAASGTPTAAGLPAPAGHAARTGKSGRTGPTGPTGHPGHPGQTATLAQPAQPARSASIRAALAQRLPDYMVPAHVVFLERLPVNGNGKLDRPVLDALDLVEEAVVFAAPATPTEVAVEALWAGLLEREAIGSDENFFAIGGHSLLAVRLMARINDVFRHGPPLPLSQLFISPTIATLAAAIDSRAGRAQLVVPLARPAGTGIGAPVWLVHPAGGTVFCYRGLAASFDAAVPVYAIQSPEIAGFDETDGIGNSVDGIDGGDSADSGNSADSADSADRDPVGSGTDTAAGGEGGADRAFDGGRRIEYGDGAPGSKDDIAGEAGGRFDLLCRRYVAEIVRMQPDGPVRLAGWSLGGALAFRMTQMLERRGREVAWIALFDTMLHAQRKEQPFDEFVIWAFTRLDAAMDDGASGAGDMAPQRARFNDWLALHGRDALRARLAAGATFLVDEIGLSAELLELLRRQHALQQAHAALLDDFSPDRAVPAGRVEAPMHVFHAAESLRDGRPSTDWLALTANAGRSTEAVLPGRHENIIHLPDNIAAIVTTLRLGAGSPA